MAFSRQLKAEQVTRKKKPRKDILEFKNNRFYENGTYLPKKDIIFTFSAHEGESLISGVTGQKYRARDLIKEYGYFPYSF